MRLSRYLDNVHHRRLERAMATADEAVGSFGIATLIGTPEQVRASLGRSHADRVIALALDGATTPTAEAFERMVAEIAPLMRAILKRREEKKLDSIVELLLPDVVIPPHLLVEAGMVAEARRTVLESGDLLTAANVAKVAGLSTSNPSAQPNKWKKEGRIFAVRHRGVDYFPGYALDPSREYRPVEGLRRVLAMFRDRKDDWRVAYWFASVNGFLGGKRPQDLLVGEPERVVAAAEDEVAGVLHG